VFVVADGMGGHEAGEVASALAVRAFDGLRGRDFVEPEDLNACIEQGAAAIRALPTLPGRGAGTTVAGVAVGSRDDLPYWLVLNIGDSRVYRSADGSLAQVTVDHSEVQEMLDAGRLTPEEAERYPRRHVVTRAVGGFGDLVPEFWVLPAGAADRMLVCSDGLTGELDDATIAAVLAREADPQAAAEQLVELALATGGHDNVTVLVVDGRGAPVQEQTVPSLDADEDTLPREGLDPTAGATA
jgi:protein phosphatase